MTGVPAPASPSVGPGFTGTPPSSVPVGAGASWPPPSLGLPGPGPEPAVAFPLSLHARPAVPRHANRTKPRRPRGWLTSVMVAPTFRISVVLAGRNDQPAPGDTPRR